LVTPRIRRWAYLCGLGATIGLGVIAVVILVTWPNNAVADHVLIWRAQRELVRGLERRVAAEADPETRAYYQAWLAEERGDLPGAIRGFQALRDAAGPGTVLYLESSLRLGLVYGKNHDPGRELATYQGLMARYPGASRLSQATFHLRRGEQAPARRLLEDALAQDAEDGSLGQHRKLARVILNGIRHDGPAGPAASR
jgi:hypothetical protein